MRLSVVFELLLVFLFLAFAAARVIDKRNATTTLQNAKKLRQGGPNRYCACTTNMCNCCRDFSLPVVPIKGPGCASIMYLKGDNMMISMSFGERVLSNMTIAGPKPKPVCMTLPGGISQFCGRIYGISRTEKNFKACLGLELRALDDIEAALRVSCFKFGPKGVNLESAPPIPPDSSQEPDDEDDEDDDDDYDLDDDEDDDLIGLGGDLDDDDDDDDDDGPNTVGSNEGNEVDSDSADYTGFSVLGEDFFGTFFNEEETRPKKKKKDSIKKTVKPVVPLLKLSSTTRRPIFPVKRPAAVRPTKVTRKPSTKITLIPRPVITKITSSTSAAISESDVVSMAPLPPVSIPPVKDPVSLSFTTATTAMLPDNVHKYSTSDKLLTASPQTMSPLPVTQVGFHSEKLNDVSFVQAGTENPTSVKIMLPSDEVKLPELDVEKIEAMAAIVQQGVTSSVIHSSAIPPKEMEKIPVRNEIVADEVNTEKYVSRPSIPMIKAGSSSKGSEEDEDDDEDDLLDGIIDDGLDSGDEEDTSGSEEGKVPPNINDLSEEEKPLQSQFNKTSESEKDEIEVGGETEQPMKVKPPEKSEEEEEESEDDFFDGIMDDSDNEEEEDQKKKGDEEDEDEENVKEEEEEDDILGAFVADPDEIDNEKEESEEATQTKKDKESEDESAEEDDFFNTLGDDGEEQDNSAEVEDDENNKPALKVKKGNAQNSKQQNPITEIVHIEESVTEKVNSTTVSDKGDNSSTSSSSSSEENSSSEEQRFNETIKTIRIEEAQKANISATSEIHEESTIQANASEIGRFDKEDFVSLPKTDALLLMKAAAKMREPQVVKLSDLLGPRKKYQPDMNNPISTSRTHRRMNLDRGPKEYFKIHLNRLQRQQRERTKIRFA